MSTQQYGQPDLTVEFSSLDVTPKKTSSQRKAKESLRLLRMAEQRTDILDQASLIRALILTCNDGATKYRQTDEFTRVALQCMALAVHAETHAERLYAFTFNIGMSLPVRVQKSDRGAAAEVARMLNETSRRVLGRRLEYILNLEASDSGMIHFHALISLRPDELSRIRQALSGTQFGGWLRGKRFRSHAEPADAPLSWILYGSKSESGTRRLLKNKGVKRESTFAVSRWPVSQAPKIFDQLKLVEKQNGGRKITY